MSHEQKRLLVSAEEAARGSLSVLADQVNLNDGREEDLAGHLSLVTDAYYIRNLVFFEQERVFKERARGACRRLWRAQASILPAEERTLLALLAGDAGWAGTRRFGADALREKIDQRTSDLMPQIGEAWQGGNRAVAQGEMWYLLSLQTGDTLAGALHRALIKGRLDRTPEVTEGINAHFYRQVLAHPGVAPVLVAHLKTGSLRGVGIARRTWESIALTESALDLITAERFRRVVERLRELPEPVQPGTEGGGSEARAEALAGIVEAAAAMVSGFRGAVDGLAARRLRMGALASPVGVEACELNRRMMELLAMVSPESALKLAAWTYPEETTRRLAKLAGGRRFLDEGVAEKPDSVATAVLTGNLAHLPGFFRGASRTVPLAHSTLYDLVREARASIYPSAADAVGEHRLKMFTELAEAVPVLGAEIEELGHARAVEVVLDLASDHLADNLWPLGPGKDGKKLIRPLDLLALGLWSIPKRGERESIRIAPREHLRAGLTGALIAPDIDPDARKKIIAVIGGVVPFWSTREKRLLRMELTDYAWAAPELLNSKDASLEDFLQAMVLNPPALKPLEMTDVALGKKVWDEARQLTRELDEVYVAALIREQRKGAESLTGFIGQLLEAVPDKDGFLAQASEFLFENVSYGKVRQLNVGLARTVNRMVGEGINQAMLEDFLPPESQWLAQATEYFQAALKAQKEVYRKTAESLRSLGEVLAKEGSLAIPLGDILPEKYSQDDLLHVKLPKIDLSELGIEDEMEAKLKDAQERTGKAGDMARKMIAKEIEETLKGGISSLLGDSVENKVLLAIKGLVEEMTRSLPDEEVTETTNAWQMIDRLASRAMLLFLTLRIIEGQGEPRESLAQLIRTLSETPERRIKVAAEMLEEIGLHQPEIRKSLVNVDLERIEAARQEEAETRSLAAKIRRSMLSLREKEAKLVVEQGEKGIDGWEQLEKAEKESVLSEVQARIEAATARRENLLADAFRAAEKSDELQGRYFNTVLEGCLVVGEAQLTDIRTTGEITQGIMENHGDIRKALLRYQRRMAQVLRVKIPALELPSLRLSEAELAEKGKKE